MFPNVQHKLGVVFFPAFDWAISPTHPEREERLLYTQDQLYEEGIFDIPGIQEYQPSLSTYCDIESVHFCLPNVGAVCSNSHLASAGGAIHASKLVLTGEVERAFAIIRPPGHHAMRVTYGNRGFCNINIEAVMVEHIRQTYKKQKIAIVDTDCHHGDGTQDIYWNDPNVLFISLHQDGRTTYPGTGFLEEVGGPAALGKTVNIPLPPGTGNEGYLYAMEHVVLPILDEFQPDIIINSAGQDNHYTDPLTNMYLTAEGYACMTQMLKPDIAVLEGGYSIQGALPYVNLGICLALAGLPFSYLQEPDLDKVDICQPKRVTETIKKVCEQALSQYFYPPVKPYDGQQDGCWWVRNRTIYYDTDMIHDTQYERIRLCKTCNGLTAIETKSTCLDEALCLLFPRGACSSCCSEAESLKRQWVQTRNSNILEINPNKS
ncbi:histone deacetylase [Lawsonia intracellularis]|uniref:Deacetylases, including yeast histone deacetylase and acetoin utilization protein n=1 Tax=Lawsonia intracellularis (strain PHE/MN1-00) TaxID=363253 RepID=Q1MQQ3_LAWIP|nr:histone deacetylase [Lawsonia intracellularis]AGC50037.1 histone deacetylase domain-containing protein [Lawsonia intracellularis N343]KAA0204734.1 histone deacetylase [Lawsonia intracellularis]MBZ3893101.1 histone deacetylase [Lawsonia intracellularis]RBN33353.1 histone deacetylase [Lawsonia intracellularis]RBN34823.1 histone deacetylase [Lawsonia intracellularis]